MNLNDSPLVSICCQTYNHKDFISKALEGILIQKTNFKFEILLRDDGSIDGTREICEEFLKNYPDIINPLFYEENQFEKGLMPFADNVKRARGKYIALCEGDDYWIDPYKLQKQVNFLEKNIDYGLVFTDINIFNQNRQKYNLSVFKNYKNKFPLNITLDNFILNGGFLAPCTWLFKKELISKDYSINFSDGSFALMIEILFYSKIYFHQDVTAVYRVLLNSASHSSSITKNYEREVGILKTKLFYINKFKLDHKLVNLVYQKHYMTVFPALIALGLRDEFQEAYKYLSKNDSLITNIHLICSKHLIFGKIYRIYYFLRNLISKY